MSSPNLSYGLVFNFRHRILSIPVGRFPGLLRSGPLPSSSRSPHPPHPPQPIGASHRLASALSLLPRKGAPWPKYRLSERILNQEPGRLILPVPVTRVVHIEIPSLQPRMLIQSLACRPCASPSGLLVGLLLCAGASAPPRKSSMLSDSHHHLVFLDSPSFTHPLVPSSRLITSDSSSYVYLPSLNCI